MKNSLFVSYTKSLGVGLLMLSTSFLSAQSVLIGNQPMQFNPAFAGTAGGPRMGTDADFYRKDNSWNKSSKNNIAFSFDHFIPKLKSGVGIQTTYSNSEFQWKPFFNNGATQPSYHSENFNVGMSIAPKFSFKGRYTFSPAAEIGIRYLKTNYLHVSQNGEFNNSSLNPSLRLGISFNSRKLYIGLSYDFDEVNSGNIRGY